MVGGVNARWYNVYQILIPVTSDVDSQRYRMVMLQAQVSHTTSALAIAEDVRSLNLGSLSNLSPEFVIYSRITYESATGNTTTGRVRIRAVTYNIGSRAGQVSVAGFNPTAHNSLSNLPWTSSGHTGTPNTIAAFDANGLAIEIAIPPEWL